MARWATIRASCAAQLKTLETAGTFKTTKAVDAPLLMIQTPDGNDYPIGYLALIRPKKLEETQTMGHSSVVYSVEFGVLCLASSDGMQLGDAEVSAWDLASAVEAGFRNFVATSTTGDTVWPAEVGESSNERTDAGIGGVWVPFTIKVQWYV